MGSTVSAVKRVQFRLRAEDKGLLQLAASYEGESLSAFIRKAALEAACSVIERNERFVLGREDAKVIIASFEQPLVPSKQPATNLWTTRASQGKKTLTNPYDRSLIALS